MLLSELDELALKHGEEEAAKVSSDAGGAGDSKARKSLSAYEYNGLFNNTQKSKIILVKSGYEMKDHGLNYQKLRYDTEAVNNVQMYQFILEGKIIMNYMFQS